LNLKKEINKNTFNLKIQIFSGERDKALELIANHDNDSFKNTSIELVYETPNYKVWIGDFYSQLEADKKLLMIKKKNIQKRLSLDLSQKSRILKQY
jgi:hypothetical protein